MTPKPAKIYLRGYRAPTCADAAHLLARFPSHRSHILLVLYKSSIKYMLNLESG